jgi:class 3 adenylate cyclase/rhodanese-related sulfurtransferase
MNVEIRNVSLSDGRRLAAIVFTDVVEYSARMQRDEVGTMALVRIDFDRMRALCTSHGGEVLKSMGDGLLLCFSSVVQAVACALQIQKEFSARTSDALQHRIGIHLGDVFQANGDVTGDGVNIAARLETKARSGTVCLSQSVYDGVKGKLPMDVESLGPQTFKNIAEPMTVYLVTSSAAAPPSPSAKKSRRGLPVRSQLLRFAPWIVAVFALGVASAIWLVPPLKQLGPPNLEVSTEEFQQIVAKEQAIVLDTRPHLEFAISHVPGALNVSARPGVPMSMYVSDVAEVSRLVGGDLKRAIVVYCNGIFCPKSKRLMAELLAAGHINVRRYQLGIPIWRAFGGVTEIEADGLRYVLSLDRTAVLIDVREEDVFKVRALPGARNLPRSRVLEVRDVGEMRKAKDDGRLPMQDHNTRIIVLGRTPGDARFVAKAIAHEAFHNVAYFPGTFEEAEAALAK